MDSTKTPKARTSRVSSSFPQLNPKSLRRETSEFKNTKSETGRVSLDFGLVGLAEVGRVSLTKTSLSIDLASCECLLDYLAIHFLQQQFSVFADELSESAIEDFQSNALFDLSLRFVTGYLQGQLRVVLL